MSVESLKQYRFSSYAKYWNRHPEAGLERFAVLSLHGFPDSLAGMRRYAQWLALPEEADPAKRNSLHRR